MTFPAAQNNATNAANYAQANQGQALYYLAMAVAEMARSLQQMEIEIKNQLTQIQQQRP